MHAARALLARGARVTGVDNLDPYYDVALKEARLATLAGTRGFAFAAHRPRRCRRDGAPVPRRRASTHVVHLAAQPGVRYSLVESRTPTCATTSTAFGHVLEGCRHAQRRASRLRVELVACTAPITRCRSPRTSDVDHPVSLYAATKKANELMAHSYSHLYRLPATGLRFFTVYGPWGRPDMAPMLFTKAILAGEPIRVFNDGTMRATSPTSTTSSKASCACSTGRPPATATARRYADLQHRQPRSRRARRRSSRRSSGCSAATAIRDYAPMQPGDVPATYASIDRLRGAHRIRAAHAARRRARALRRLVPRVLPRVTAPSRRTGRMRADRPPPATLDAHLP